MKMRDINDARKAEREAAEAEAAEAEAAEWAAYVAEAERRASGS